MNNLTIKELADLNRMVKKQHARFSLQNAQSPYFQKPDAECPAYIRNGRRRIAELSALQNKLEQMILESDLTDDV